MDSLCIQTAAIQSVSKQGSSRMVVKRLPPRIVQLVSCFFWFFLSLPSDEAPCVLVKPQHVRMSLPSARCLPPHIPLVTFVL